LSFSVRLENLALRVSKPCSRFDHPHPILGELLPVGGGGVARDFGERGMPADRGDLVCAQASFRRDPAEGFA
jgi:hypothetical protein